MKVFVTKYALTQGILEFDNAELCETPGMIRIKENVFSDIYFHNDDWHTSKKEAIEKADEIRIKKLKALERQMKKISAIKF